MYSCVHQALGLSTNYPIRSWLFYDIRKEPKVLDRLRAEHDEALGSDPTMAARVISQDPHKLNSLRYTAAVIKESLRLHPLASTHRQGSHDFNFVYGRTTYSTYGCLIHTNPSVLHLRPDLWPRVTEFLPQRFLVGKEDPLYPVRNAWRAFELGNTRCIGEELAMMEMKLALVLTLRELDFFFDWEGYDKLQ
jgi:cytochrome P450